MSPHSLFDMIRRNARLRKEYIYRKSLEGTEREVYEKKRKIKDSIASSVPHGDFDLLLIHVTHRILANPGTPASILITVIFLSPQTPATTQRACRFRTSCAATITS